MILSLIEKKLNNFEYSYLSFFIKKLSFKKENFINFDTEEFNLLFTLIIISLVLALIIFFLSFFLVFQTPYFEKNSAYECGFLPFQDARLNFDVRFYLVAILFIIFDLEISFLFPWSVSLSCLGYLGFFSMIIFLVILTLGFVFEWQKGALDWT